MNHTLPLNHSSIQLQVEVCLWRRNVFLGHPFKIFDLVWIDLERLAVEPLGLGGPFGAWLKKLHFLPRFILVEPIGHPNFGGMVDHSDLTS